MIRHQEVFPLTQPPIEFSGVCAKQHGPALTVGFLQHLACVEDGVAGRPGRRGVHRWNFKTVRNGLANAPASRYDECEALSADAHSYVGFIGILDCEAAVDYFSPLR